MSPSPYCVFCSLISARARDPQSHDFTEHRVNHLDEPVYSFPPRNPVIIGHRLFVPLVHFQSAANSPVWAGAAFEVAARYGRHVHGDFNLITSVGPAASQTIGHLHVHLVPRTPADNLQLPWTRTPS